MSNKQSPHNKTLSRDHTSRPSLYNVHIYYQKYTQCYSDDYDCLSDFCYDRNNFLANDLSIDSDFDAFSHLSDLSYDSETNTISTIYPKTNSQT